MGSVLSVINDAIEAAIHEFVVSILDILLFLFIMFLLTVAGWFIAILIRVVFNTTFRNCGRKKFSPVPDI